MFDPSRRNANPRLAQWSKYQRNLEQSSIFGIVLHINHNIVWNFMLTPTHRRL
jgi:hypothetical protein